MYQYILLYILSGTDFLSDQFTVSKCMKMIDMLDKW